MDDNNTDAKVYRLRQPEELLGAIGGCRGSRSTT
jgi:hypothetical protein